MRYLIWGVIIIFVLWKGKDYLRGAVLSWKNRKQKPQQVDTDLIYVPVLSSRVFNFSIEIKEIGEGKASIAVIKNIL